MKKWLITALVSILVVSTTVVFANVSGIFELVDYNIKIGNDVVKLQYPMYINDGRIYVSLRGICDKLGIPIEWNNENREVEMDIYNKKIPVSDKTLFREDGVIPDEETALAVGKTILEKYVGKSLEYETDEKIYYLKVTYIKESNVWNVTQFFDYKDGRGWAASGVYLPNVKLNKNTGEVMYINTHSTYTD